jgi:hypothetical protein
LDKAGEMSLDAPGFEPLDDDTLVKPSGSAAQTVSAVLLIREHQDRAHDVAARDRRPGRALRAGRAT